jgi:hypothetical protein
VAHDVVRIVQTRIGLYRFHFRHEPGLLAEWESASHVVATPRSAAETGTENAA